MRIKPYSIVLILVFPLLLASATDSYAKKKMYRWVDENGKVYFSDTVPPDQVQHKRETLNEKARVLDVLEKAKTPDELAQQRRLEALRKEQEAIIAKQEASDKVLLATYRSLEDINKALENKLALMEGEQRVIEGNKGRFEQQLLQQQQQAANFERNAQKVPEKLLADIAASSQQIEQTKQELERHQLKRQTIEKDFKADIARFQFLTQSGQNGKTALNQSVNNLNSELGLFVCQDATQCEKAWKIAGEFVYQYATTNRDVETDNLIMTAAPFNDDDLSLSVSKLDKDGGRQIFLDIRCKSSAIGKELCGGEKARTIRQGFVGYIQQRLASQQ